jgi:histidinol phosphatase-like enzyme
MTKKEIMKLLVLDKDGTLTRTKSGHIFVQHPEDQVLIDGVADAIAAYAADGWTMAIASNQGGCEKRYSKLYEVPIGAFIEIDDKPVKCESRYLDGDRTIFNGEEIIGNVDKEVAFRYKTINMAIAEMQYAMKLANIWHGMFCPDMAGETAYQGDTLDFYNYSDIYPKYVGKFRKPQEGMLNALRLMFNPSLQDIYRNAKGLELLPADQDDRYKYLMIGDRGEDFEAAVNAGFGYMHVSAWLEPFIK